MKRAVARALVLVGLVLAACSLAKAPSGAADAAHLTYVQLRDGQDAALYARGTPELRATPPATLAQVRSMIPREEPLSSKTVAWTVISATDMQRASIQQEYVYRGGVVETYAVLVRKDSSAPWEVYGFHVDRVTNAQIRANAFTLADKRPRQYLFLLWAAASPLLMIAALVSVVRCRGLRRKWLWGILAFAGLGAFHMNWTTGQITVQIVSIQLIGAGVTRTLSVVAPWIVSATIPIGAVVVLWRTRVQKTGAVPKTEPAGS